jgi:hypothetical protein
LLELPAGCRRRHFVGSWRKDDQLRVAAIDQRKLGHLLLLDHRTERHRHRVNHWRSRIDGDGFLHGRRSQREVHNGLCADYQPDTLPNDGLKSRKRRFDVVRRW